MNINELKKLLSPELSFDIKALYSNRLLQRIGAGLLGLFLPIFLFEQFGYSAQNVILFYIAGFGLYVFAAPIGAMTMSKLGLKNSMAMATIFLAGYYLCFYFFDAGPVFFLVLALITATLFRMFYWVPYHTDFAEFITPKKRGRQIAFLTSIIIFIGIGLPLLAGFIIEETGFDTVFLLAVFIVIVSLIPLFYIRKVYEKYSYSYLQTYKELLSPSHRKMFIGYAADGAQAVVGVVIWPIFIYQLFNHEYIAVGAVSSAIILVTILFNLIVGGITDRISKRKLIRFGSVLFAFGWIMKAFVQTGFQIFIVSSYHSFAGIVRGIPFSALIYEEMADQGHYIDEYTVLREISLAFGKVIMLAACFVLIGFAGLNWVFVLAAIVSLLINIL